MSGGKEVVNRLLSSEIKGDLLTLFHRNPGIIDAVEGVARRIGRASDVVKADVKDLVDLGVLRMKRVGSCEVVFLDRARDRELQEIVVEYLKSSKRL